VVELNQGEIEEIFAHTYRTCRLFPFLLKALGQLNSHNYLRDVETKILEPILTSLTHKGYATQFARDFETYGLYEAIVYLHDVDFVGDPRPLFVEIAQVYRRIAADYDANRHLLYESDDPRLQEVLEILHEYSGEQSHNTSPIALPLTRQTSTEAAKEDLYLSRNPIEVAPDRNLMEMVTSSFPDGTLFPNRTPKISISSDPVNAAFDVIATSFTFHASPSATNLPFRLAEMLSSFGIHPLGKRGVEVIGKIVTSFNDGMFGDYDRWIKCARCTREIHAGELRVGRICAVLERGAWLCDECEEEG
jgi:hypothetical protein